MIKRNADLVGDRFQRLTVVAFVAGRQGGERTKQRFWLCRCDCGGETIANTRNLRNGNTKSCGCLQRQAVRKRNSTHGMAARGLRHPLYATWALMRRRCNSPTDPNYPLYGGRGIIVCERWNEFENFLADMGARPFPSATIDRIDNNGNYEPGNVRWAAKSEQSRNTRRVHLLTLNNETMCLADWAKRLGMTPRGLRDRLTAGWALERVLTQPPRPMRRRK